MKKEKQKAWVIAVDMGYGHQRAADPLHHLAYRGQIINANNYIGIPKSDLEIWGSSRKFYEFISRFKKVPLIGELAFKLFDRVQEIPEFYPKRDLSDSNLQVRTMLNLIKNKNWGKHLIDKLKKKPLPLITTFFAPAFMAEEFNYPGEIYTVATDTDISRAWVTQHPGHSRIKYFAPNERVVERLKSYGVPEKNIFLTGFPLPDELLGDSLSVLKHDLTNRLVNLDPNNTYRDKFGATVGKYLGQGYHLIKKSDHLLTLMFAVGGAGAQRELGIEIVKSLKRQIRAKKIRVLLVAGTHIDIKKYFHREVCRLGLRSEIGTGIKILHDRDKIAYFKSFNRAIRHTDILWTKPSELSFYSALGLPIIMAPTIGSQETFNRRWLHMIGAGLTQDNPAYTNEWLFDLIDSGWFAEAAMQGFLEAPKFGTDNIQKVINSKPEDILKTETQMSY